MRLLLAGMIVSVALGSGADDDGGFTMASYISDDNKGFVIDVHNRDLLKSLAWKTTEENPPVSAGNAIRSATRLRDSRVRVVKERPWKLESADLCQADEVDRWYWRIQFVRPNHDREGRETTDDFRAIVLMNGTVLPPREVQE